ncbi:MAG: hypothetical protein FD146_2015 [Anaerolineaceae bacterium]|nr:MAG: hypothetical protein FD146_2015 [Anaerolineaceae bacterium]
MERRLAGILFLTLLLAACGGTPSLPAVLPTVPPTGTPRVLSPTRTILWESPTLPVSPTLTFAPSPAATDTPIPPTGTPTSPLPTDTPTHTPVPPLAILFSGCNTSLDITHSMGEVTNAYVTLRNYGSSALTNLCATLSASDEARAHPDKTQCAAALPALHQILLKLTVDTGFQEDTSIQVDVVSEQGITASASQPSCRELGFPGWASAKVGVLEPIP